MSDSVSRQEFGELVTQLKELVIELKHTNANNEEMKRRQEDMGKRVGELEKWQASATVTIDEVRSIKKLVSGALVSHVGTIITLGGAAAYFFIKGTGGG